MKVTVERIPDSQVLLSIEIEPERVQSSLDQAFKRFAPHARVPGFRPGKAPRAMIERHYGRQALLNEALDALVPAVVQEAIEAESIDMIDRPSLEITSLEPVTVKATVPVKPTVELGDYRSVRVEQAPSELDPAEVDRSLEELRRRYAVIEPVERPVADSDVARVSLQVESDGTPLIAYDDRELSVSEGDLATLPGLHAALIGMAAGEEKRFEVSVPEDAENPLAGKTLNYFVAVKDVKQQTLPDLDDEFAKEVGESFPTLTALRERIESDLRKHHQDEADRKLEEDALSKMVEGATIEFPPHLVEREIERMLRDQGVPGEDRKSFDQFLRRTGLNEDLLRGEFRPHAVERVRRSLVLSRLLELEQITVAAEEIDAELESMLASARSPEQVRGVFGSDEGREYLERTIASRKVVERMRLIARGEAPPLADPPADADPPAAPDGDQSDGAV